MTPLPPPDSHILSAAEGWLELGNLAEAKVELAQIGKKWLDHPEVLSLRWDMAARENDWKAALELARILIKIDPDSPQGWLHQAYALRRVKDGGLQAAWDCLFPVMKKFPEVDLIPYNLACYACQNLQLEIARDLLKRAMKIGDKEQIRKVALRDNDLQPLWLEITNF